MNKQFISFCIIGLCVGVAIAGFRVTEKPLGWKVSSDPNSAVYKNKDECLAATVQSGAGAYTCQYSTAVTVVAHCDDVAQPAPPPQTDAWAVQLSETEWGTEVPGWVSAPAPTCWVIGRVPLEYHNNAEEGPPDLTPGPTVYTVDPSWAIGGKCPHRSGTVADPHLCYAPPNPPIPPAP